MSREHALRSFCVSTFVVLVCGQALAQSPPVYQLRRSAIEENIRSALHEATHIDFVEQPLSEAVQYLEDLHSIQIEFDSKIEEAGVSSDTPITCNLKNVSLSSALNLLLKPLHLEYLVANDVLLITTVEAAEEESELRIYTVADLHTCADSLAEMIQTMYKDRADQGALKVAPVSGVLVIRDTQRGHEQIAALLDTLRLALSKGTPPSPLVPPAASSSSRKTRLDLQSAETQPDSAVSADDSPHNDPFGESP